MTPSPRADTLGRRRGPAGGAFIDDPNRLETDLQKLAARILDAAEADRRVPIATYRIQFNQQFTFRDAAARLGYLHDLGVSDLYASPYFRARPESTHGYDVTDHNALNPAVGDAADYRRMTLAARRRGMGQVLDVVPNHMGVGAANPWWLDVLENGAAARHAEAFDIDWGAGPPGMSGKVLLPILGDQYGEVLERGELQPYFESGSFFIRYWDHILPIDPRSYPEFLRARLDDLVARLGAQNPAVLELQSIITAATNLPSRDDVSPERTSERDREKEIIKRRLAALCQFEPAVQACIEEAVREYAGTPGDARSFDRLDALIDQQAYRLSFWRVAAEEINYRRFFDINDLAAIRVERPSVFRDSHRLLLTLLAEHAVTGVRVDHIDGLWDPAMYTLRLQAAHAAARYGDFSPGVDAEALEQAMVSELRARQGGRGSAPLWLVVEKILGSGERLPDDWAVSGTTGYDFAIVLNGLFVDGGNRRAFDDIYTRFAGMSENFRDVAYECKQLITTTSMASELNVLGRTLYRLAQRNRRTRDFTLNSLTDALREVVASFPVYRTYVGSEDERLNARDRAHVESAIDRARRRNPAVESSVFDFVRDTLLLRHVDGEDEADRIARRDFVMKFQQYTGPVTAKGVEDTAFYRYNRLVSLNEVGGEPEQFGVSPAAFHRHNAEHVRRWPDAMTTTSTHDTKRGEDTRARINVLSELPREWRSALARWSRANRRRKRMVDGAPAPDRNEEYLFYQILIGAWPADQSDSRASAEFVERVQQYLLKAVREAKVNTSWINPHAPYDEAVQSFVAEVLNAGDDDPFMREFLPLQHRVARVGVVNSLAQLTLKLASPGVPDIYQGTELWDLSLVDPDNRRPVDYERRAAVLRSIRRVKEERRERLARDLLAAWPDGRVKLYVLHRGLTLRRDHSDIFQRGDYVPLEAGGPRSAHLCAFARRLSGNTAVAIVPRLVARLMREPDGWPVGGHAWADTWLHLPDYLEGAHFRERFTGAIITVAKHDGKAALPIANTLATFPVALLEQVEAS